jgi:hypothetical protein
MGRKRMMKLWSKNFFIFSMLCLLFVSAASGSNSTPRVSASQPPLKLSVANIIKDIVPPVRNPQNFSDIEVEITFENISKRPVQFDQIQAVFLHHNKPVSASTYIMEKTGFGEVAMGGYYSDGIRVSLPKVSPNLLFTLKAGQKTTYKFQTANSRYGNLSPLFKRELVLNLYKNNKLIYGPFKLTIKL